MKARISEPDPDDVDPGRCSTNAAHSVQRPAPNPANTGPVEPGPSDTKPEDAGSCPAIANRGSSGNCQSVPETDRAVGVSGTSDIRNGNNTERDDGSDSTPLCDASTILGRLWETMVRKEVQEDMFSDWQEVWRTCARIDIHLGTG